MPIILLRGLAREAEHWQHFPDHLNEDAPQTVLTPDCAGCGVLFQKEALNTIPEMTDQIRATLGYGTAKASSEKMLLVGISMGGMIALDWASRFPQELKGMVLINSSMGTHPLHWRLKPGAWFKALEALTLPMVWRERIMLRQVSNLSEKYPEHEAQWLAIQKVRPVTRATIIKMLRAAVVFKPPASCQVKGLVLCSEQDRLVSFKCSQNIASRYDWPVLVHPSAGHDLPMDAPHWVSEQVLRFQQSLSEHASNRVTQDKLATCG